MLIRPKSASRTRTIHVDSMVNPNTTDSPSKDEQGPMEESSLISDNDDNQEADTCLPFDNKVEIIKEGLYSPKDTSLKEPNRKNAHKRSSSSQEYKGIFSTKNNSRIQKRIFYCFQNSG